MPKKSATTTFFEEVVDVTYVYLGPAANRFVARQVRNHLDKKPEQLRRQDLVQLIDWFTLAMALLSEDTKLVKKYSTELRSLASQ